MNDVSDEVTQDWLDTFYHSEMHGEEFADSIFWQLALDVLPLGVNPEDSRVQAALVNIRESVIRRSALKTGADQ